MENDSIRASGTDTLVDIWINGKLRAICVTKEAIDAVVGSSRATGMSDEDRCEFVRGRLPLVVTAAKTWLSETSPAADRVVIDVGQLGGTAPSSPGGDRRKGDRRKTERRKGDRPKEDLPQGERRRGDRRRNERRRSPGKSS
jgi:hypothetical protein